MGAHRGHPATRPRDEGRYPQKESGGRIRSAPRQRRDLHRRKDQIQHTRARRLADSPGRVRVVERGRNQLVTRAGSAEERPRSRRESRHD